MKAGLAKAILEEDFAAATVWVVNLHKFVILYGLNFSKEDHIYLIKVELTKKLETSYFSSIEQWLIIFPGCFWTPCHKEYSTRHIGQVCKGISLAKNSHGQNKMFGKTSSSLIYSLQVLSVLLKKKYLLSRADLQLDWRPLFELLKVDIVFRIWTNFLFPALGILWFRNSGFAEGSTWLQCTDQGCCQGSQGQSPKPSSTSTPTSISTKTSKSTRVKSFRAA